MASSCLWLQTFRLAVPCRHSTGWTGGPQRAAILGRRGLEPQFSDSVASICLYATRPRVGAGLSRLSPLRVGCLRLAPIGTRFCFLLVLYPRKPVPACTSPEHWIWCRRLGSNQRHTSWRGALPTELHLRMAPARIALGTLGAAAATLTGAAPAYGAELILHSKESQRACLPLAKG